MIRSTVVAAALIDELAAIVCPVTRAIEVKTVAKTLRTALARLHRESLQQARERGDRVRDLAESTRVSPGRIYQLTRPQLAEQETSS